MGGFISILLLTLFWKVLSNFRRNLTIRHLGDCLNSYNASTEVVSFKTFFQFALCVTRTKYQNRFCLTNTGNYSIVVNVEMSRKLSLAAIIRRYLRRFIGTPLRGESPERRSCFSVCDIIS